MASVLPDVLPPGLRIVFCGTAVGDQSARRGAYYAHPQNQFWRTLHAVGLTPWVLAPEEFGRLPEYGIGLTDLVKGVAGNDDSLTLRDFDTAGLTAKIESNRPVVLAFNGLNAAGSFFGRRPWTRTYGPQALRIGDTAIWVVPSTSSAARWKWSMEPWRALALAVTGDGNTSAGRLPQRTENG